MDTLKETSFWGMTAILMGLIMALWGLRLMHNPATLPPKSYMYRYIYYRFFAWRREDIESPPKLTERQIRLYAIVIIIIGILGIVIGVTAMGG